MRERGAAVRPGVAGRRFAAALIGLLAALAACGDAPSISLDEKAELETPDRFAIHTREGEVKLALTDDEVYVRLSDEVLEEAQAEMQVEDTAGGGIGDRIASAVKTGVSRALRARMGYDLERIDRLEYVDGELRLFLADGERAWEGFTVDAAPLGRQFEREDALRFIEEFEKAKAERAER